MKAWEKTLKRMTELGRDPQSNWQFVPSDYARTIRFTVTQPTPDYARERWGTGSPLYDFDTYDMHVFVTLVGGKMILGTAAAPWVRRQDRDAPFWLADAVLEDPSLAFDGPRQLKMKRERHGPGRGIRKH